jgi:septal ring-binding cell division protein DamX
MPRFNLRDPDPGVPPQGEPDDSGSEFSPSTPRGFRTAESGRLNIWLIIAASVAFLVLAVVLLNQFHVIHLWGKKTPKVVVANSLASTVAADTAKPLVASPATAAKEPELEATPLPTEPVKKSDATAAKKAAAKSPVAPTTRQKEPKAAEPVATAPAPRVSGGSGSFAVQISSWPTKERAEALANSLSKKGYSAFVAEGDVNGKTWYRVRVGSYSAQADAGDAVAKLKNDGFDGAIVVKQ